MTERRLSDRLRARRTEILLLLSLLIPLLAPSGAGALLAGALAPVLPGPGPGAPDSVAGEGYREAYLRLLEENARLRDRLFALGEPANLVAADPAFWDRNPLRIEAWVLGRDASPWRGSLEILAGSRDGIREGMPVTVGGALVGTIATVGPRASRVRLLTDPGNRVWAAILTEKTSGEGYLEGTGEDTMGMHLVRTEAGRAGDPVYTAGGRPLVPRGLFIGRVARLTDVDEDGIAEAEVEPAVDADRIRVVNVIVLEDPKRPK